MRSEDPEVYSDNCELCRLEYLTPQFRLKRYPDFILTICNTCKSADKERNKRNSSMLVYQYHFDYHPSAEKAISEVLAFYDLLGFNIEVRREIKKITGHWHCRFVILD